MAPLGSENEFVRNRYTGRFYLPLYKQLVLKLNTEAGLVTREQRGKWAYYRVDTDTLRAVAQAVSPAAGR